MVSGTAFLGGGNMATALVGGLLATGAEPGDILVADLNAAARQSLADRYGVRTTEKLVADDLREIDILVLAVKPQQMQEALAPLAGALSDQVVVSVAAGLPMVVIGEWLGGYAKIVRAMPNTPALIRAGITGLCARPEVDAIGRRAAERLMHSVGTTVWFDDEAMMDGVTAISGSGPAYFFLFIEALQQAGLAMGFSEEQARLLAIGTAEGAARLAVQSDETVSELRARVTSKGGTTEAALHTMQERGVPDGIIAGAQAALARGRELGAQLARTGKQN
ncbi:MAG TPA: pyrroline-5-carboxylate reductase [Rhodocyclaceae bacterium]